MSETYCGKICEECMMRQPLKCPGCQTGPGKHLSGDCKLAQCCQDKGHETCDTCSFHSNCVTHQNRHLIPDYRLEKLETEHKQKRAFAKHAVVLGQWLWSIFWLFIAETIAKFFTRNFITDVFPFLYVPGHILATVCTVIRGLFLMKLSAEESRYRTAAICAVISHVIGILIIFFWGNTELSIWAILLFIPTLILSFVGVYNEYIAYSNILINVDKALSSKWCTLWKWYIGTLCLLFLAFLVIIAMPLLGLLILVVSIIGCFTVGILHMVYLYRTAKLFRNYN